MKERKKKTEVDVFEQIESWMDGEDSRSGALRALCALIKMGFTILQAENLLRTSHELGRLYRGELP